MIRNEPGWACSLLEGLGMMQLEVSPAGRVRVIGACMGAALSTLLEMVKTTDVMVDLSAVREVDTDAVHLLAWLAPEPWSRLVLPKWLEVRIEMERMSWLSAAA